MLTKKEAEKIIKQTKGEVRGAAIKVDLDFVMEKEGKQGVKKLEKRLAQLGVNLKHEKIRPMDFYPMGKGLVVLLSMKELFNYNEKNLEELGIKVVKFSLFMKILMKYFSSLKLVASQIPDLWRKHYTIGNLEMPEYSEQSKYVILRLKDFKIHPIYCSIYKGYFSKTTEMVTGKKTLCRETKCMFRGNPYHEFLLTW